MQQDAEQVSARLQRLVDHAQSRGAAAAEILSVAWTARSVETQDGHRTTESQHEGASARGRIYLDGGRAAAFSARSMDELAGAIDAAVERAKDTPEDPAAGPAERFPIHPSGIGLYDRRYAMLEADQRAEVAKDLFSGASTEAVVCTGADYSDVLTHRVFVSSRGLRAKGSETRYDVRVHGRLLDGRFETSFHAAGRAFANIGALPYGTDLAMRLTDLTQDPSGPPGTSELAVVLEPWVLATLVARLGPAFTADRMESGKTFVAKLEGQAIGGRRFHLVDDATMHGSLLSRRFDDRGVAPMPVPLVREGQLGGLLHDPETARRAGARPTGHSMNGNLEHSNLVLRKGNRSRTQMLGEVPVAMQFDRLEGTLDVETGAFDLGGPAYILEAGKRRGCVSEARIRGDICDLLRGVKEIASNQQRHLNVDCATGVFEGFPVTFPS